MIMRLSFVVTRPDKLKEMRTLWNNEIGPTLKKQKGFIEAIRTESLDDPGFGATIQLWESKDDVEAWHSKERYKEFLEILKPLTLESPRVRLYEVMRRI